MAAYAALLSLMNTMEDIKNHPHLSTSLNKNQIEFLREKVFFFVDFMESYDSNGGSKEVEELEREIASAAHEAEDIIESHVVDQTLVASNETIPLFNHTHLTSLFGLQKVILDMDYIKEKVITIKEKMGFKDQKPKWKKMSTSSRSLTLGKTTMVGFDDYLTRLLDWLTRQRLDRQIISIVGMAGIGKTTLARNVFEDLLVVRHFDVRVWVTVSQNFNLKKILLEALSHLGECTRDNRREDELGEQLYKILSGRRYLIILDDMWSTEVWDKIKFFLPNNGESGRVILTTRLSKVATYCSYSCIRVHFLDHDESWNLLCEKVFGHQTCPPQLENIGRKIAKLCRGLPLSIVVIGGLLRKSYGTIEFWHNISENIKSILHLEENEHWLDVLSLSYNHLPVHLKPCFVYMGIFLEDEDIRASRLIKLWVAEGFLKPNDTQILEKVAEGYLKDLVDRNLILVGRYRRNGKIKSCRIHDLLRELCIKIAEKEKFFCVERVHNIPQVIDRERRLIIHDFILSDCNNHLHNALQSTSLVRSLICKGVDLPIKPRLLRVLDRVSHCSLDAKFHNVNLRYFACQPQSVSSFMLSSSISLLWNLQTLIIRGREPNVKVVAPSEIWKMPQLRHVECDLIYFPDPPQSDKLDDALVLGNLQTLLRVVNLRLSEEVYSRIPNIKKLHIIHDDTEEYDDSLSESICNTGQLYKLESLSIRFFNFYQTSYSNFTFPSSLNKLVLARCRLHWEDLTMIGLLPQLEVLMLGEDSVVGGEWSPNEGEFLRLKFLRIIGCELRYWNVDNSHFPVLEKLDLGELLDLEEIPSCIGKIPTLEIIQLGFCSESAIISALKIKEEQESVGNYDIRTQVIVFDFDFNCLKKRMEMEGLSIYMDQLMIVPIMAS